ncbi:PqqD family peptide modification chaperone [Actinomyces trachealis]|uniref:PqqD family peptide modification chaperone n=1 Tax=Actinomyces trachealis TaxID=2763540 RepID=UPI0039A4C9C3
MYKLAEEVSWNNVEDGAIVLVERSGEYMHLDKATCDFIDHLTNGQTVEQCIRRVAKIYPDENVTQIRMDYSTILQSLLDQRILEVV